MNIVVLRGTLSSPPRTRRLASGTNLVTYEVTSRTEDAPATSVQVAWFCDDDRLDAATGFAEGDEVLATGVVRRRYYRLEGTTRSATEVVADDVVPANHRRAKRLLDSVGRKLVGQ